MNKETKAFLGHSGFITGAVLAFSALAHGLFADDLPPAFDASCASAGFFLGLLAAGLVRRAFSHDLVSKLVATAGVLMGAFFAAARVLDQPLLLVAGAVIGVAVAVFALRKQIDEHVSAKMLLFVPMAQVMLLVLILAP